MGNKSSKKLQLTLVPHEDIITSAYHKGLEEIQKLPTASQRKIALENYMIDHIRKPLEDFVLESMTKYFLQNISPLNSSYNISTLEAYYLAHDILQTRGIDSNRNELNHIMDFDRFMTILKNTKWIVNFEFIKERIGENPMLWGSDDNRNFRFYWKIELPDNYTENGTWLNYKKKMITPQTQIFASAPPLEEEEIPGAPVKTIICV